MLDVVLDLSHHNTISSFARIRTAGIRAMLHKATQGTSFVDERYRSRRQRAHAAQLLWGAYHFGEAGNVEGQVTHFLDTVRPRQGDLLVLDFEAYDAQMTLTEAEDFVQQVQARTGRYPGLYSGQSFLHEQLGTRTDTPLRHCFLWLARYSTEPPDVPEAWNTWSLWQYTDQGSVPGVTGPCDRNQWHGDLAGLHRLWGVSP